MPLSASNLPTAEVDQRPLLIDPKAIEVAPRRMLSEDYVRSLGLRRIVPIAVSLQAEFDEESAHQCVFRFSRDAAPIGREISSKAIAPIAATNRK
jgi:hypothetical protein